MKKRNWEWKLMRAANWVNLWIIWAKENMKRHAILIFILAVVAGAFILKLIWGNG